MRNVLRSPVSLAAILAALLCSPAQAQQDYPNRPIKLVCAFVAGSGADIVHRYFADKLRVVTGGAPIIVENKPGASGNLAHAYVANSKPDGYTVYPVGGSTLASSVHLFKQPPIDPMKDLEPINTLLKQPWLLTVAGISPFKTVQEVTAHLKQKKDKASYSTATVPGTTMGEMYKAIAGLQMVQVNYKTAGDSLNDLMNGTLDVAFVDPAYALREQINGRLRILAVSTAERTRAMSDVPTMTEGGVPGMDIVVWWATMVPAGTPPAIKEKLRAWFDEILRMEDTEKFLRQIGTDPFISTPEETSAFLAKDIKKWGEAIKIAKIQPE